MGKDGVYFSTLKLRDKDSYEDTATTREVE